MALSGRPTRVGRLPGRTRDALAVLDALAGSRANTALLLANKVPLDWERGARGARRFQYGAAGSVMPLPARPILPKPGSDPEARKAAQVGAGVFVAAGAALDAEEALREARDHTGGPDLEYAFETFGLDRTVLADVYAARAWVWAKNKGPWAYFWYWEYGWSGPVSDAFAQALMRYEREYPGTVGAAVTQNKKEAWDVITGLLTRASAAVGADQPIAVERDRISEVDDALSAKVRRYRAAVQVPPDGFWAVHHLIPFVTVATLPESSQRAFVTAGWGMDRPTNLIPLPANVATYIGPLNASRWPTHAGGHGQYNTRVSGLLAGIAARALTQMAAQTLFELTTLETAMRGYLLLRLATIHPTLL